MPWTQVRFNPGIVKDRTRYASENFWYDGSLVRFSNGLPESWKGWDVYNSTTLAGIARSITRHADNSGFEWLALGTNERFYVYDDETRYDVTPVRATQDPLGNNPIATTNGSATVVVTDTAHGAFTGQYVILSGLTGPINNIPASELNAEHIITYLTDNTYSITVTTLANASSSGGGAAGIAKYLLQAGSESQTAGGGWGSLGWGEEEWGGDPTQSSANRMGIWTHHNWGEDLVANPNGGNIYLWDRTNPSDRMVALENLASADGNAPTVAEFILMSHRDRHLIAFGCDAFSTGTITPMLIRWSDQESLIDWDESDVTQTAGSLLAAHGSKFISGVLARDEIIFWSDTTMYALQYIGGDLIFGIEVLAQNTDIAGLKSAEYYNDIVYWMGLTGFYMYTGRVERMQCPVWDYVENRIDKTQLNKVICVTNKKYDEVVWFYPTEATQEITSYVAYNVVDNAWSIGELARTCWLDSDSISNPIAFDPESSLLIEHEVGYEDGVNGVGLDAYIESGPVELSVEGGFDKGDRMVFIRRIIPDVTFMGSDDEAHTPTVTFTVKMMDKPGGGFDAVTDGGTVTRGSTVSATVEEFTDDLHVRLRGRSFTIRVESDSQGTQWRMGVPRLDVRTDGQR